MGKESETKDVPSDKKEEIILSRGQWNEKVSWEFIVSKEIPDIELCTAMCCVTTFNRRILLIKNKRGWEIPAGHKEKESPEEGIVREVYEETRATIENPQLFGYKKLTATEPIPQRGNTGGFYPFPHSYVAYYYAEASGLLDIPLAEDVTQVAFDTYEEAQQKLASGHQYENILEYLIQENLIEVD